MADAVSGAVSGLVGAAQAAAAAVTSSVERCAGPEGFRAVGPGDFVEIAQRFGSGTLASVAGLVESGRRVFVGPSGDLVLWGPTSLSPGAIPHAVRRECCHGVGTFHSHEGISRGVVHASNRRCTARVHTGVTLSCSKRKQQD